MPCQRCLTAARFEVPISMAFQPIVDFRAMRIFAYEALLRGKDGTGAGAILGEVSDETIYSFDQSCRVTAIELANELGLARDEAFLSINFLPNAVYEPKACIQLTLETASRTGFPVERIMFEFTESERIDSEHLQNILRTYRDLGFLTAIDDFGAGFAGLGLLAEFQPDFVKLDMALIRGIEASRAKRAIVVNTLKMLEDLGVSVICEGVETPAEFECLLEMGVEKMQGYLFAKPALEALPVPDYPVAANLLGAAPQS